MNHQNKLIEQVFFTAKDFTTGKEELYEVNKQDVPKISPFLRNNQARNITLQDLYYIFNDIIEKYASNTRITSTSLVQTDSVPLVSGSFLKNDPPTYEPDLSSIIKSEQDYMYSNITETHKEMFDIFEASKMAPYTIPPIVKNMYETSEYPGDIKEPKPDLDHMGMNLVDTCSFQNSALKTSEDMDSSSLTSTNGTSVSILSDQIKAPDLKSQDMEMNSHKSSLLVNVYSQKEGVGNENSNVEVYNSTKEHLNYSVKEKTDSVPKKETTGKTNSDKPLDLSKNNLHDNIPPPNPEDLDNPENKYYLRVCFICKEKSEKDHARHYGAIACFSCRAFFRRTHQGMSEKGNAQTNYNCKNNGNCEVTVKTRRQCQKCRHNRCIKAGMRPEAVMNDDQIKNRFHKMFTKRSDVNTSNQGRGHWKNF